MIFSKTKKAEARKLRFIEANLYSIMRDLNFITNVAIITKEQEKEIDKMIEYRAREILEWL